MQYHSDRFSVFFGNNSNGLEGNSKKTSREHEEACAHHLTRIVSLPQQPLEVPVLLLQQVHGTVIHTLESYADYPTLAYRSREGDGLITALPRTAIGVLTADCMPIIFYNRDTHRLAIVHAGWRGMVQGIIQQAIKKMGLTNDNCTIVLGACARGCCYQVGQDFLVHIPATHAHSLQTRDNNFYFDLHNYARQELAVHDLSSSIVYAENSCTICDANFYSYRRERPACVQRQATVAVLHD